MSETQWQVLVRGSENEWRNVPDGRTAGRLVRENSEMFTAARFREIGEWQSPSLSDSDSAR